MAFKALGVTSEDSLKIPSAQVIENLSELKDRSIGILASILNYSKNRTIERAIKEKIEQSCPWLSSKQIEEIQMIFSTVKNKVTDDNFYKLKKFSQIASDRRCQFSYLIRPNDLLVHTGLCIGSGNSKAVDLILRIEKSGEVHFLTNAKLKKEKRNPKYDQLISYEYKVRALFENSPKGTYKGIIPVDFAGRAVNLEEYRKLADEYNLWIIEDACHAPGGYFSDSNNYVQKCGNGNFADLAIFSFHPVKHIACGEGGMITTNNETLYKKLLALRSHGITKNDLEYTNSVEFACGQESENEQYPGWYMEMQILGFNYRITDFQAALGSSQLQRADEGIEKRRKIAFNYDSIFNNSQFIKGQSGVVDGHAYHLYVIEVENRLGLYNFLRENKVYAQIHYIPCHLMPYYKQFGWKEGDMPFAENYYKKCISLPMFPSLSFEEQNLVIDLIKRFYGL